MSRQVIVTDEDATRVIKLRRPEKKNAITQEMFRALSDAIDTAQNNPEIRCIILTGASGVFTAGNDLDELANEVAASDGGPRATNATKFLYSLVHNVKPLIAAVDGSAVGIGTSMLFHCDYVVAGTTSTFSTPFIQFGLVPQGASSLLMPLVMGHQRAFAALVMGRTISANDARIAGFVNAVVPPGHAEAEARKAALEICELPPQAVAISRRMLRLPPEEVTRRIDHEDYLAGEQMHATEAAAAFKAIAARKKA